MKVGGIDKRVKWYLGIAIVLAIAAGVMVWWLAKEAIMHNVTLTTQNTSATQPALSTPEVTTEVLLTGRDHIWDMAFLPGGDLLFTERGGTVSLLTPQRAVRQLATVNDIYATGEGGLMGVAVDPAFEQNRYVYTCFNAKRGSAIDVRVARWVLKADSLALEQRSDIVSGIASNQNGRHSGCRLSFGPDGYLWVGVGDAAIGGTSQDPKKLNGKMLRIDHTGKAAPGNMAGEFDARIYSYGHRNIQGIAFFAKPRSGVIGVSAEHGSTVDDELNPLKSGNFGWAPAAGGYNENGVPMTDLSRFPQAVPAIWSSGTPTQAPSGIAVINGSKWQAWNGAVAIAMLKAKHLKILQLDDNFVVTKEEKIILSSGRLRAVTQGPDGSLYISTDNGQNDQIIRVTPS